MRAICTLYFLLLIHNIRPEPDVRHPIIIIPGDGGCQAYCRPKNSVNSPFLLWIDLRYFLEPGTLYNYFSLKYDPLTGKTSDSDLCDVVFPGWGETWSIDNLDTFKHNPTRYCAPMIEFLQNDPFFVPNVTVRGAPIDFRKTPKENVNFVKELKLLIEETYLNGGGKPVVLFGHSMGTKYGLHFLRLQSRDWKRKYIKSFVAVSPPLGGSVKALKIEASGDNFHVFLRSPLSFRSLQRSMPSLAFLLPDPRLWPSNEPLIITPDTNYTAHDYERFFRDINFTTGYQMMLDSQSLVDGFEAPKDVDEIYCIYGSGLSTTSQLIYSPSSIFHSGFPDQVPLLVPGDGDGTVSLRSLEVCKRWPGVKYFNLRGAEHVNIMGDPRFLDVIAKIVGIQPVSSGHIH